MTVVNENALCIINKSNLGGDSGFDRKYEFLGACQVAKSCKKVA